MNKNILNDLNQKKRYPLQRVELSILFVMATVVPVFADISNIGVNAGTWITDQLGPIALAVIAYMALRYLMKKAWPQFGVFLVVGSVLYFVIKYPDKIESIGAVIFGILTK